MTGAGGAKPPPTVQTHLGVPNSEPPPLESPKFFISSVEPGVYVVNTPKKDNNSKSPQSIASTDISLTEDSFQTSRSSNIDRSQIFGVDENAERGNWTGRLDFILSMLGYAVGLGNLWRFPYLCYRNGGGAFLVPYLIFMTVVGIPLFFMETSLAQFTSCGPTSCWGFSPLFSGIGIAMCLCSGLTSLYYNMIIAWCMFYFFVSFQHPLPWSNCDNDWNTADCRLKLPSVNCEGSVKYLNGTCYDNTGEFLGLWNTTLFTETTGRKRISPSEEYYNKYILGISSGIDDVGAPRWQNVLVLLLAWTICFFCLIRGIKTTGKVVYFTAVFPYVLLLILFFRGVTLENAGEGIKFYILPEFSKLASAKVWRDAAVQIFYSMGPGWGGLIALSSYNRFHNNIVRDSLIVSLGNCMTSIFGGFVIFSYIGFMAGQLDVKVDEVATSGAGLVFVIYPEALNSLPGSTFWAIIFFFMLITLGLDSQFATVETVLTGICDSFPDIRKYKSPVIGCICIVSFLLGLPMCTPGGVYILQILDYYVAAWSLLLIGLTEVIAITYVYGWRRFCSDIELMTGTQPSLFWKVTWMATAPIGITFILIFAWIDYTSVTYGDYVYPGWVDAVGWLLALSSVIFIPGAMIYKLCKEDDGDTILEKVKLLLAPSRSWGPALVKHRELVDYVNGFVVDPFTEKAYLNRGYSGSSINGSVNSLTRSRSKGSVSAVSVRSHSTAKSSNSMASRITFESTL
ncbi:sodium- and chloride-dependent glycine transporter 1-like [Ruditapes philippinarum]|uniref:sodium- and chloride-dependent glycine transporter 1-like n=1 Tax=Ruditapes philippinarum TaxID=129788 RepID=UPI00295AF20F|nr:sodium- and chloride-dependent glycine transporter 1-like [Ruditapes philippinarum]XP_060590650.1 sodium- and chloride-dependent glycine transporter 1-like [Ruditapes philippinarum]